MRFEVFGPVAVSGDDDTDVTPRGAQQRRLLTALVAAAPAAVSVDQLTELLWPEGAPSANALQAQVSKIRKAIAPVAIVSAGRGYAIDVAPDTVDVHRFERLVERAGALADTDPDEARCLLERAETLAGGRPYDDIADTELGRAESVRVGQLVRSARRRRLEIDIGLHTRVDAAAAELEALTVAEPLDEHWWALLMTAQYRLGRQAEALRTYQTARRVLAEELGLSPGPELRELEQRILGHDPELTPRAPPAGGQTTGRRVGQVPSRLVSIIGREDLLDDLDAALDRSRLVTLTGPGGAGKTTIAAELARRRGATGPVIFVELAPLGEPDSIVPRIASTLGLSAGDAPAGAASGSTFERVIDALAGTSTLVVLDNCEHLVDSVAKTVHELLEACPDLTVVATSREALGVPGEIVQPLPQLDVADAVRLFLARAAAAAPGVTPEQLDRRLVAEICLRLDRLPLAIELAAARVRSMQVGELLDRLDDRFLLLASGPRTFEPRQQTLRAVVDWSYELLDEIERVVFRRLAAFGGGATLAAAEAVCGDDEIVPRGQVAAVVERLIDKSLVVVERASGASRYGMLQTLAEYAADRLAESGEVERVRERHARFFADLIAPALRGLLGREQRAWITTVTAERENLRVALEVAVARCDAETALRLTAPLGWYFYMVGQAELGCTALEDALACPGPTDPSLRAIVLAHYGWLSANGPDIDDALEASAEALALVAHEEDPWVEAFVLITRIMALFFRGLMGELLDLMPAAEDATRRARDGWTEAIMSLVRAEIAQYTGDAAAAEDEFRNALELLEEVGDEFSLAIALTEAAEIAEMRGDYEHALEMLRRGIEMSELVGFSSKPLAMRARMANVETLRGNYELAEQLHLDLLDGVTDRSIPWVQAMSYTGLATVARRTGRPQQATEWIERAWDVSKSREVPVMHALVLVGRGYCADLVGDHERALRHQRQALAVALTHSTPRGLANTLEGVAGALALAADAATLALGATLLGAADAVRRGAGGPMPPAERFDVDRAERRLRAALGDEAVDARFAEGAGADIEDLVKAVFDLP